MKNPYIKIVNTDGLPYESFLWAYLETFNRKASEVSSWTSTAIIALPNTPDFGFSVPVAGQYTAFRKRKISGVTDYVNVEVLACDTTSTQIVFVIQQTDPASVGFSFTVYMQLIELGGNIASALEYGFSLTNAGIITNWQDSNTFDLISEGVYFFDVRVKGQTTTAGRQSVELYTSQDNEGIGGGDESDNQTPNIGSSED